MFRLTLSTAISLSLAGTALAQTTALPGDMPNAIQPASVVTTSSGPIQGLDDGQMVGWLGVPYAAPPVGNLRWMPPQAVEEWTDIRGADHIGNACSQGADLGFFATPGGSEDCLTLNVYGDRRAINRARRAGERLPVFVWIHGGALNVGQGADYDPRSLIADGKAIVVTINYRLGVMGFFAHPAIDAENHPAANYGQMDQTFALRWVQDNISEFGGDPSNVTIAGESSGGTSVIAQVLSPWARGLFQNAIVMSGGSMMLKPPHFGAVMTQEQAQQIGREFAGSVGCVSGEAACLRDLSTADIISSQVGHQLQNTTIDGDFLPDWPELLLQSGKFNRVNLLSGNTSDEGDFFVALPEVETGTVLDAASYPAALEAQYGLELAGKVEDAYGLGGYHNASKAMAATVTDYLFACPSARFMDLASAHTTVRAYEFADRTAPSYSPPVSFDMGAAHTFEIPYLFEGFHGGASGIPTTLNSQQEELAADFRKIFTTLSDSQNWDNWPAYTTGSRTVQQLQVGSVKLLPDGEYAARHNCAFWDAQGVY